MQELQPSQPRTTLTKSETIVAYLQQMALPSMWPRVLSESDYELWDTVLGIYSAAGIKFAFDNWITNGHKFPLPADILPLCISFQEQQEQARNTNYKQSARLSGGHVEILALWEAVCARKDHFLRLNKPYIPLTEQEVSDLLREINRGTYIQRAHASLPGKFPNGNPRYNRELTQARALTTV